MRLRILSWLLYIAVLVAAFGRSSDTGFGLVLGALLAVVLFWAHQDREITHGSLCFRPIRTSVREDGVREIHEVELISVAGVIQPKGWPPKPRPIPKPRPKVAP